MSRNSLRSQRGSPREPLLQIIGRHDALRAALVNLALNGIDAAGHGGSVWLSAVRAGSQIILAVDDSGAGPPDSVRDSMHEPFVTSKPEGIGLGLAVAQSVAEEHGGTLAWERHDSRTRFAISLPAQTLKGGPGPSTPTPSP